MKGINRRFFEEVKCKILMSKTLEFVERKDYYFVKGDNSTFYRDKWEPFSVTIASRGGNGFIPSENIDGFRIEDSHEPPKLHFDFRTQNGKRISLLVGIIKKMEEAKGWVRKANQTYPYNTS